MRTAQLSKGALTEKGEAKVLPGSRIGKMDVEDGRRNACANWKCIEMDGTESDMQMARKQQLGLAAGEDNIIAIKGSY